MMTCRLITAITLLLLVLPASRAEDLLNIEIDFAGTNGVVRPLHGINKGPLAPGGLIDVTEAQKALSIPFTRLHDCHWPNPDVVDIHAIFPNFDADPDLPESYEFAPTDEYIEAIRRTGAEIVFRLGESIEHTTIKRFVHPPKDPEKWTRICLGIIRHYNEGWASGFHYNIRYWEIWNEPENRPVMWTGTDEQFLHLYQTAARTIKERYPHLKVGGPAFGSMGRLVEGKIVLSPFAAAFLDLCQQGKAPLDFFSWHCYTATPSELAVRAKAVREVLDQRGFKQTESHLNEWNFLPGNSWDGLSRQSTPQTKQKFYEEMGGAPGAAFIVAALLQLQDAPLDMGNLFHGEVGGFGLFTEHGGPMKVYYGLLAFRHLLDAPHRVPVQGTIPDRLPVIAGLHPDRSTAVILFSNLVSSDKAARLNFKNIPWAGPSTCEIRVLDQNDNLEPRTTTTLARTNTGIEITLKSPSVVLVTLRESAGKSSK